MYKQRLLSTERSFCISVRCWPNLGMFMHFSNTNHGTCPLRPLADGPPFFPHFYFSESLSLLQADIDQRKRSVYTSFRNGSYQAATKRRVQTESQYVNDNATDPIINQPDVKCIAISISPKHGQARSLVQKKRFCVRE